MSASMSDGDETALLDSFAVAPHVRAKKLTELDEWAMKFIARSPLFFIATASRSGGISVSPRGGAEGFVRIVSSRELVFDDCLGNALFESYRNILSSADTAMIFVIPGVNETLRVSGAARIHHVEENRDTAHTGLIVHVAVRQCYYHCGRALKLAGLWDVQRIVSHVQSRPVPPRPRRISA